VLNVLYSLVTSSPSAPYSKKSSLSVRDPCSKTSSLSVRDPYSKTSSLSVRDQVLHPHYENVYLEVVSVHMFMFTFIKVQSLRDTRIPSSPSLYSHRQLNHNGQSRYNSKQRHHNFFTTSLSAL
jgi:hypothetical protein